MWKVDRVITHTHAYTHTHTHTRTLAHTHTHTYTHTHTLLFRLWRPWIPQMLASLARPDSRYILTPLLRMARMHPNALYYSLRTCYLELRSAIQSAGTSGTGAGGGGGGGGGGASRSISRQPSAFIGDTGAGAGDDRKRTGDAETPSSAKRIKSEDGKAEPVVESPAPSTPSGATPLASQDSIDGMLLGLCVSLNFFVLFELV